MAHGVGEVISNHSRRQAPIHRPSQQRRSVGVMGSRRIFSPSFKLRVLDSYRYDIDCKGNQRATARKYGIHRRQIQKWLQCEESLRNIIEESKPAKKSPAPKVQPVIVAPASPRIANDAPAVSPDIHEPQRPQQPPNNGAPAEPALNSGSTRQHGDDLAVQQQQPPPPPAPSAPVAAQALAASHQQVAAAHAVAAAAAAAVGNFHFHGPAAGYPDLKDSVPVSMQPPQYAPGSAVDYYELYQAAAAAAFRHSSPPAPVHHHHQLQQRQSYESDLHPQQQQRPGSFPAWPVVESPEPEQPQRHYAPLLAPAEIKTERASPDSLAAPVTYEPAASAPQQPKKECADDEESQRAEEEREHSTVSSHLNPESIETLPLSPEVSGSDSEMSQVGNGSDQIRRRSFPVRFKIEVLDAFHKDAEVSGNQRATARKFRINRRQVQKWLSQENELRGVVELCGNNRQRLGPGCALDETADQKVQKEAALEDRPVDLTTGMIANDFGQVSPPRSEISSNLSLNYYESVSLTPPYSAPGCPLSCCQDVAPVSRAFYYCYSPGESAPEFSLKRPHCSQPCCYLPAKKTCYERNSVLLEMNEQPEQETPLCLVKNKRPDSEVQQVEPVTSTVPSPPAAPAAASPPQPPKKSAILFKPYLDNPVSKPSESEEALVNNNKREACDLNERNVALDVSLRLPTWGFNPPQISPSQQLPSPPLQQLPTPPLQHLPSPPLQQLPSPPLQQLLPSALQQPTRYLEYPQVSSAFARYRQFPGNHYS